MERDIKSLAKAIAERMKENNILTITHINNRFIIRRTNGNGKAILPTTPYDIPSISVRYCLDCIEIEESVFNSYIDLENGYYIDSNAGLNYTHCIFTNVLKMLEVAENANK